MPKERLLLVVGAGASLNFGMPSVAMVRDIINAQAQKLYPLANYPRTNLYEHIERRVRRYWKKNVRPHLRRDPQFEDVLYTIFALAAAYPAGAYTSALGALMKARKLHDFIFFGRGQKPVDANDLRSLGSLSVDAVLSEFRELCKTAERDRATEFASLSALIAALRTDFEVAVVSLNYDNIVYRSLHGIETGFDPVDGRFDQDRIFKRREWPCMLHLHGSVHFDMRHDPRPGRTTDLHEVHWQPDISATFHPNAFGRSTGATPEGADFPTSVIVAGYGKTTQLLRRPFRTYYSELDRLVSNCDAVLFAGYGFGDPHLNMAFDSFRDSRRRPVAIIGFAENKAMTAGSINLAPVNTSHYTWVTKALETFATDQRSMRWLGHSIADTVRALKKANEFEISSDPNTQLSFWYNGILLACDHADKVIERLKGSAV